MEASFSVLTAHKAALRKITKDLLTTAQILGSRILHADISIFHQFAPPPSGGGHQFLRALQFELTRRGLKVENNRISRSSRACLINSFNFDVTRLRRMQKQGCTMVHRVDGPISLYRDGNVEIDRQVAAINHEFAHVTIFQSQYSLDKHLDLGIVLKNPCVITNSADPRVFNTGKRQPFSEKAKTRLIATSWSDNWNKGAEVFRWMDENLDWTKYDFTFVGRSPIMFNSIKQVDPCPPQSIASMLKDHDIYVMASRNDACSNALIEAQLCGLPALYIKSGGNSEIVKEGGLAFESMEEIPSCLDRIIADYHDYQRRISVPSIEEVADLYLAAMRTR